MTNPESEVIDPHPEAAESNEIIRRLRQEITSGRHWYPALLKAIGQWNITEETINGRNYRYLISGEAFDWLVLAERLCEAIGSLLPETEKNSLLFHSKAPLNLSDEEFKESIGEAKYHQYLNFYYGVTVEEALMCAVEEEIRKERISSGFYRYRDNTHEIFRRIYGYNRTVMLKRFRKEKGYSQLKSIKLNELKEFTYWLFKHRLKQSDKARVASDTKKGLDWLKNKGYRKHRVPDVKADIIDRV